MQLSLILAIAGAEVRSIRRLTRYWVFSILTVVIATLVYLQMSVMHGMFSHLSATVGAIGPRYLISGVGLYLLIIFLIGLIFLAFDVRARDEREGIAEVLLSRPLSNAEFLLGRCCGLVFMSFLPVLFVLVEFEVIGFLALLNGWPVGETLEPYSIISFMLQSVSSLTLWCAMIVLVSVIVKNRLIIALIALGLLGLQVWLTLQLPLYMQPIFTILLSPLEAASDLVPTILSGQGIGHLLATWFLSAGFVILAIGLYPRRDAGSKSQQISVGGGLVVMALLITGTQFWQATSARDQSAAWLAAHEVYLDAARANIQSIKGGVIIDPGNHLNMDLTILLKADAGTSFDELVFSFNPGISVQNIAMDGERVQWRHEAGLLKIIPVASLNEDSSMTLTIQAIGLPDTGFGYLDTAFDLLGGDMIDAQIGMLGFDIGMFTSDYVALMPGNHWLPSAGSGVPSADARTHPPDFFQLDLEVEVPSGWLVAGPGKRQLLASGSDTSRFRFQPGAPVSDVGVMASQFERRAVEVAGVELEVLVNAKHNRNLLFFADSAEELKRRLDDTFSWAERVGITYPYGGLSLVEIPNRLRGYKGGWRMDTAMTMPGLLLLRENSFPTSRFEIGLSDEDESTEEEGDLQESKIAAIEGFFENDFSGGNVFINATRNFLGFQTSATGEGALAINFVLDELVSQLLTGKRGYFSAHEFTSQANVLVGQTITDMVTGRTDSIADAVMRATTGRPSVWDRALGASLADMEPTDDPRQSLNVLVLKGRAIARSILAAVGKPKTGELLAEILTRFRGRHFTEQDLRQVASDLDVDLGSILGDWLHESALPGFIVSDVQVYRLLDDELGNPRYQTRLHIRNDEPAPGLLQLNYDSGPKKEPTWHSTEPIRFAGNESREIGILSVTQPWQLYLSPYLALNRQDQQLFLPKVDPEQRVDAEPFLGSQSSHWMPAATDDIIIDDLDSGFAIQTDKPMDGRIRGRGVGPQGAQVDLDQGLPVALAMFGISSVWSRVEKPGAWGKYRKTYAMISSGDGTQLARFSANLPHSGKWRLAYHMRATKEGQNKWGNRKVHGKYNMALVAGAETQELEFDGSAAEAGWNDLGEFDLPAGNTHVEVSNKSEGIVVEADAIRWRSASKQAQD